MYLTLPHGYFLTGSSFRSIGPPQHSQLSIFSPRRIEQTSHQ
jgi:hypothetical protein